MKRAEYTATKYWQNFKSAVFYIFLGMLISNTGVGAKLLQVANKAPAVIASAQAADARPGDIGTQTYNVTVPVMPMMQQTISRANTQIKSTGFLKEPSHD